MAIVYQQLKKTSNADPLEVKFTSPTKSNPVVLVTPVWLHQTSQVRYIETVVQGSISKTGCKVVSDNFAPENYYVNVVAIDSDTTQYGTLAFTEGAVAKTSTQEDIDFSNTLSSPDPVAILTPTWSGSVGYVETQISAAASEMSISSANMAPSGYYVQYAAADRGRVSGANGVLETGSVNKGQYQVRIYFSSPFKTPPVVIVSPWWDKQPNGVRYIETVVKVTRNYFEIVSGNAGENYFVNWMALSPG
ncbi:MAG: H-type lectin domain-containing protein [Acidobacteriia bacterium]|nr:H-type lectin domain-containing protein [Terriglobia bacterium]